MNAAQSVAAVVHAGGAHLPAMMARLEARLAQLASGHGLALAKEANATIAAGGKRLRPLLLFLAAGRASGGALAAAAAVELVHSATLVHDDVLDGALVRRGHPTVAARAGRGMAASTGDLLFSRAFAELAANGRADHLRVLSEASSALALGELAQRADAWDAEISEERYLERCELKTARLFEASARLGALEAGAPAAALGAFGSGIGLAFQLLDDVLDVSGPQERTGKRRGTDLLDGTVTLPLILARGRDPDLARIDLRSVRSAQEAERLCDRIEATGALEEARRRALDIVVQAKATLPEMPIAQRSAFDLVADGVVDRYA